MNTPPGWYPDPYVPQRFIRYWNGAAWVGDAVQRPGPPTLPPRQSIQTMPGAATNKPRNDKGTAALVCGLIGILPIPIIGFWFSLAAIITGWIGYKRVQREEATNGGMAISGFVLGIVGMGIQLIAALAIAFRPLS